MTDPATLAAVTRRLRAAGCVFAEDEAALLIAEVGGVAGTGGVAGAPAGALEELVARRVAGEPLEHLLGWVSFAGLRIAVEPGVFIPRARTELLVEEAVRLAAGTPRPVVVDLCCGAGAIGVAIAHRLPGAELHAADLDPAAVACARRNLAVGQLDTGHVHTRHVHVGDLDAPLPADLRGRVDLLTVNAPYVPTDAIALMAPEARDHEPRLALDGGPDGLDVLRRAIAVAPDWLVTASGHLLFEAGTDQLPAACAAVAAAGLTPRVVSDEERGATVVVGSA